MSSVFEIFQRPDDLRRSRPAPYSPDYHMWVMTALSRIFDTARYGFSYKADSITLLRGWCFSYAGASSAWTMVVGLALCFVWI